MKTELETIIRRITTEHRWKLVDNLGYPNQVIGAIDNDVKFGAVRAQRKRPFGDWAVNLDALRHLDIAKSEGRVSEGVVLLYDMGGHLAAMEEIKTVMRNLGDEEPEFGQFGRFFWLDGSFRPTRNRPLSWDDLPEKW